MVYDGKFKISIPFDTNENIKRGKYTLEAKLHYQACDSKTCFFPKDIIFPISIKVLN
jgi:hypothetical protein